MPSLSLRSLYLTTLVGSLAAAQNASPTTNIIDPASLLGARASARGGATAASNTIHDSVFQNPAGAAFTKQYAITVGYQGAGDALAASIVDTKSGPVGGGVYYTKRDFRTRRPPSENFGDMRRSEERAGLSLFGRASEAFGIGISAKYAYRRSIDATYGNAKNWNGDVGARYIVSPQLTIGAVGQNMLTDESGLNPRNIILGVESPLSPGLLISAQVSRLIVENLSQDLSWAVGGEFAVGGGFTVRAGYDEKRPWRERYAGAGLGYETKDFALDYSARIPVTGGGAAVHTLTLSGYL